MPYRKFPIRRSEQLLPLDDRSVCGKCVSGACCSSEGPVALTNFDVLRFAVHFDISPAQFMLDFTQDRFEKTHSHDFHRAWIDNPDTSVITFLRRRANALFSPCIFLKYTQDSDGTPRRRCSVHTARPLACREYYFDTCKIRWSGELATSYADGYEGIRDGEITADQAEAGCKRLENQPDKDLLSWRWQYAFWSEMRRATDIERANNEGAKSYAIEDYQDPIDEKLNRLLSKRFLRFEEKYGLIPHGEQLDYYPSGKSFKRSPDYDRISRIVRSVPRTALFSDQDYPYLVGLRSLMPGASLPHVFGKVSAVGPANALSAAIADGWNFLLGLAGHATEMELLIETEAHGAFELALLDSLSAFSEEQQRSAAGAACLSAVKTWASPIAAEALRAKYATTISRRGEHKNLIQLHQLAVRLQSKNAPLILRKVARAIWVRTSPHIHAMPARALLKALLAVRQSPRPAAPPLNLPRIRHINGVDPVIAILEAIEVGPSESNEVLLCIDAYLRTKGLRTALSLSAAKVALKHSTFLHEFGHWQKDVISLWPALSQKLGLASAMTPGFLPAVQSLLRAQATDGSWGVNLRPTELPSWQSDYLLDAVRTTGVAIEGLLAGLAGLSATSSASSSPQARYPAAV